MRAALAGITLLAWVSLQGCGGTVGPDSGDKVSVVATSPYFHLVEDDLGWVVGDLEVDVTNLNEFPLYVFRSCGLTAYQLQRKIQQAWLTVPVTSGCMAGLEALAVPARESRRFTLKVYAEEGVSDGIYRVDLWPMGWLSDPDEAIEALPLSPSERISDEFQIVVER